MRPIILLTVSMLTQTTFPLYIPNDPSSTIPVAGTSSCLDHDEAKVVETTNSPEIPPIEGTQNYLAPCHSITSLSKRGPVPGSFVYNKAKERGYYELHGEKATDHLYDVKEGTILGNEIVERKGDELIKQMWKSVGAPRNGV